MPQLLLASSSPRRQQLLQIAGYKFESVVPDIEEVALTNEKPVNTAIRLAVEKAECILHTCKNDEVVIVAADTIIDFAGKLIGKPQNKDDFLNTLTLLSNKWHTVITGVSVISSNTSVSFHSSTKVQLDAINQSQMHAYWNSNEPQDKSGSYAMQGFGSVFVKSIEGSASNVVGLPIHPLGKVLAKLQVHPTWLSS